MGRKPMPEHMKKTNLTIAIRKETIEKLKKLENYNQIIQKLLDDYFKR